MQKLFKLFGGNMLYTIENEFLQLTVTDEGGTMTSLIYKKMGEERLWQGEEFWKSMDVVIFPIIGHANPYKSCGKEFSPKSHGVVRYSVLGVGEKTQGQGDSDHPFPPFPRREVCGCCAAVRRQ